MNECKKERIKMNHEHGDDCGCEVTKAHTNPYGYFGEEEIVIHSSPLALEGMRSAGKLASKTLDYIKDFVVPGVTTAYLDDLCHNFILKHNAIPAPLNYKGFPKSTCISINNVVCHGIPGDKKIMDKDIVNIDVTVILDGWHGDTNRTFCVGKIPLRAKKLVDVTYEALVRGIKEVAPDKHFGDIGHAIQSYAESQGFSVVRDFTGHGIGHVFHAPPSVYHFGSKGKGPLMKEGMFFTIEPMINSGGFGVKVLSDGWTAVTRDKSLSAQFEHTIAVTKTGYEVLTLADGETI